MRIQRRLFIKHCIGLAASMGLPMPVLGKLTRAMAADCTTLPKIIWLNGANCSGCTVSLAKLFNNTGLADFTDLLLNTIDLTFDSTLMAKTENMAVQELKKSAQEDYILAVDGGIPTAPDCPSSIYWTDEDKKISVLEAIEILAPNATAVLSIGNCASYGRVPAGIPNPTGIVSLAELAGPKTINIPGCPIHPNWIVWTLAHLLSGDKPHLDELNRPSALYATKIHKGCHHRIQRESKNFESSNRGTNLSSAAETMSLAYIEKEFPDNFALFYNLEYNYCQFHKPAPEKPHLLVPLISHVCVPPLNSKAALETKRDRTRAEGKAITGQVVTLFSGDANRQMAAVTPTPISRQLKASSRGQVLSTEFSNVPLEIGERFLLKKAVWRREKRKLIIAGDGRPGSIVDVFNVTTNNKVGKTTVDSNGKWRIIVKKPVTVVCTIRAVCAKQIFVRAVKNAPANCI